MSVHRQACQACGGREHRNLLVREPGFPQTVFVRCARCRELVARYVVSDYYHHGAGLESYLRSHGGDSAESGRRIAGELLRVEREALEGYRRAVEALERAGKDPDAGPRETTPEESTSHDEEG